MAGRKVAIAIGVATVKSPKFPFLSGAVNGARGFHEWASKLGYESRLVTDEDNKDVTLARLESEFDAALGTKPIRRLLIYFAGHGLFRGADEGLWLLSNSYQDLRAVGLDGLRRRLSTYDIQQVAFFSDCCRSLPPDMDGEDLTADGILDRGPKKERLEPQLDRFLAAQDGKAAFMVPGDVVEEDRCLFSGLLLEALWGTKTDAFSKLAKGKVTSTSLGDFLRREVPKLAARYGQQAAPRSSSGFPEDDNIYFPEGAPPASPAFLPWPPRDGPILAIALLTQGPLQGRPGSLLPRWKRPAPSAPKSTTWIEKFRKQQRPSSFETRAGFAVNGGKLKGLWTGFGVVAGKSGKPNWWHVGESGTKRLSYSAPVLIEFADGLFSATTALPMFIGSLLRESRGVSALVYRKIGEGEQSAMATEAALAAMEAGGLRSDAATDMAVDLRQGKHVDPVLGVISAYLYDSIGDVDSIRRMAYYYVQHQQTIPYDIALLAQLQGRRDNRGLWVKVPAVRKRRARTEAEKKHSWTFEGTRAAEGAVGGLWPWMRQGWTYLDDPADDGSTLILPGLIELIDHIQPARFATLDAEGGRRLAQLFDLKETATGTRVAATGATVKKTAAKKSPTKRPAGQR